MEELIKLVCATDDGKNFSKEHFGSATKYLVYNLNIVSWKLTKSC